LNGVFSNRQLLDHSAIERRAQLTRGARSIVAICAFLIVWECISRFKSERIALFPPPDRVAAALFELARSGDLGRDLRDSVWRAVAGFAAGSLLGISLGLLTGRSNRVSQYVSPLIQLFRPLPPVAIIPLVIVWFGIGDISKVFSIAFAVFFPVWVSAHVGASDVPVTYLWSARTMGVRGAAVFYRLILPAAFPYIVSGLRTGLAMAFVMVFVSELAGASSGIGYQIESSYLAYRVDRMIAALVILGCLGAFGDLILTKAFHVIFPWLKLQKR
jgi:ABC-type nitrate/sulfonate/bicarbonate transport system permease component